MDLGSELRTARERLGLSLGDIAERTKIRAATLRAIENDDFDRLPPAIFTRGFLKTYAREVGLDPEAIAERFAAALQEADDAARRDANPASGNGDIDLSPPTDRSTVETAALIVVAGLLVVLLNRWQSPPQVAAPPDRADLPRAAATQGHADRDAAVATTGPHGAAPIAVRRSLMRIELQPQGRCWVEATADGTRVVYKLLNAGDRHALEGHEELILKVGDPAQFAFSIDGAAGRALGPAGQPITVRITRANAPEFIAAR